MKKNIFLGLMLLSLAFSVEASLESGEKEQPRSFRAMLWSWVPAKRYVTHQTIYGVAGGGAAYTAAHCTGASDGWLGWIGLGGLCGGVWLGNRQYRSLEEERGELRGERNAAQRRATGLENEVRGLHVTNTQLIAANGVLEGERNTQRDLAANRQRTIERQNVAITGLHEDVAAANARSEQAEGEFKVSIDSIKKQTGLHAIAHLGAAYTNNRSHQLNLKKYVAEDDEIKNHVELLKQQNVAYVATAQHLLASQGAEIGGEVRMALPSEFTGQNGAAAFAE